MSVPKFLYSLYIDIRLDLEKFYKLRKCWLLAPTSSQHFLPSNRIVRYIRIYDALEFPNLSEI